MAQPNPPNPNGVLQRLCNRFAVGNRGNQCEPRVRCATLGFVVQPLRGWGWETEDKTSLHDVLPLVRRFLEGYRLRLHAGKCVVLPVRWGVPFLGWRLYPDHRRLRRSTGVRFQRRLRELAAAYGRGEVELVDVRASVASWIGHLKHGNTWGLRRKLLYETVFRRELSTNP